MKGQIMEKQPRRIRLNTELRNKISNVIDVKMSLQGLLNAENLEVGKPVKYIGDGKLKGETFTLLKINKKNAVCLRNNGDKWNIKLAMIESCGEIELNLLKEIIN